jgi:glycerate 2-kinase
VPETPKPDDARLAGSQALVVGNNALAAQVALRSLEQRGFVGRIETLSLQGPVEEAAAHIVALARSELSAAAQDTPASLAGEAGSEVAHRCVILGGETTVRLSGGAGAAGKGGRCSHMALVVARELSGVPGWSAPVCPFPTMFL